MDHRYLSGIAALANALAERGHCNSTRLEDTMADLLNQEIEISVSRYTAKLQQQRDRVLEIMRSHAEWQPRKRGDAAYR